MRTIISILVTLAGFVPVSVGNVNGNFWGTSFAPTSSGSGIWGTYYNVDAISWDLTHVATSAESSLPTFEGCAQMWLPKIHKSPQEPLSLADSATCANLSNQMNGYIRNRQFQMLYDTGKKIIETCYNDSYFNSVFGNISAAMDALAVNDTSIFIKTRQWLESVLYLNTTDPSYFCYCVVHIAGTFQSVSDTTETLTWKDENCGLSIEKWLWENDDLCDTQDMKRNYNATRYSQHEDWLNDTTVPYDTTLPTMQQLGLDTVLNKHLLLSVAKPPQGIISNASANPNPTGNGTVISFGISKEAYVKIELFDVLGHEVSSYGYESLFEPGNKSVPLSLMGLPSGTYYARIMSAYGEVQTVKLVKE